LAEQFNVSPGEVRRVWSFSDTLDAHMALDAIDASRPPPPKTPSGRR
jgi:hypothetical protein